MSTERCHYYRPRVDGQPSNEIVVDVPVEALKSWWVMSHNTEKCFGCKYCILSSRSDLRGCQKAFDDKEIGVAPGRISDRLRWLPVAINNYYGDPGIQWQDTVDKLTELEATEHLGPVGIISKSYFSPERAKRLAGSKCKVVVLESVSGLPVKIEPINLTKRFEAMKNLVKAGVPVIAYLRPLIPGFNTDVETIKRMIDQIAESGVKTICYSGLRGSDEVMELLRENLGEEPLPPQGHQEWQKDHKLVSDEVKDLIESYAKEKGLAVFRKTSCAVSYETKLGADYNCHFVQPEKYGCVGCPNNTVCANGATAMGRENRIQDALFLLGAEGEVTNTPREIGCQLKEICTHACSSCPVSGGTKLHLEGEWTLGELSLARWVAGTNVVADKTIDSTKVRKMYA